MFSCGPDLASKMNQPNVVALSIVSNQLLLAVYSATLAASPCCGSCPATASACWRESRKCPPSRAGTLSIAPWGQQHSLLRKKSHSSNIWRHLATFVCAIWPMRRSSVRTLFPKSTICPPLTDPNPVRNWGARASMQILGIWWLVRIHIGGG